MAPNHSFVRKAEAGRLGGARDEKASLANLLWSWDWSSGGSPRQELRHRCLPSAKLSRGLRALRWLGQYLCARPPCPVGAGSSVPQPRHVSTLRAALHPGTVGPCHPRAHHPPHRASPSLLCQPQASGCAGCGRQQLRHPQPAGREGHELACPLGAAGAEPEVAWPLGSTDGERWWEKLSSAVGDAPQGGGALCSCQSRCSLPARQASSAPWDGGQRSQAPLGALPLSRALSQVRTRTPVLLLRQADTVVCVAQAQLLGQTLVPAPPPYCQGPPSLEGAPGQQGPVPCPPPPRLKPLLTPELPKQFILHPSRSPLSLSTLPACPALLCAGLQPPSLLAVGQGLYPSHPPPPRTPLLSVPSRSPTPHFAPSLQARRQMN